MIELGATAKDIVTGFEGVVTGRAQYLTGCDQYVLTPKATVSGTSFSGGNWFDENRLVVQKKAVVKLPAMKKPGGPATGTPAPTK